MHTLSLEDLFHFIGPNQMGKLKLREVSNPQ